MVRTGRDPEDDCMHPDESDEAPVGTRVAI